MRLLVVSDEAAVAGALQTQLLRGAISESDLRVVPLKSAMAAAAEFSPDLLIVVMRPNLEAAFALLPQLRTVSQAKAALVGPTSDPKQVLRALNELGVEFFLDEESWAEELDACLSRLRSKGGPPASPGRVIAVLSPSGGGGASTVAVNLAVSFAKKSSTSSGEVRTALFDLHLPGGDLASLLDLKPKYTLRDFCSNMEHLDRSMFEQLFCVHSSGVHLLAGPDTFEEAARVSPDGVGRAIALARDLFRYVVLDVERSFQLLPTEALRRADIVVLVFQMDFTSLRNARRTSQRLTELGIPPERVRLVVNRYGEAKQVSVATAEKAVGALSWFLPYDPKSVNLANNLGVPVVLEKPSARVSKRIMELAESLNGAL